MSKTYRVNEVFLAPQGEGVRAGTMNVFVRFSGCNMRCAVEPGPKSPGGFDCDTEFESGRALTLDELYAWVGKAVEVAGGVDPKWLILTGGEPGLQVDENLCDYFHGRGYKLAIETNGSVELPTRWGGSSPAAALAEVMGHSSLDSYLLDWITVSPKVAEHAIRQKFAHEVKYVRGLGQDVPKTVVVADHYLISPAFDGLSLHPETMKWCLQLIAKNPTWRLSVQLHKGLGSR